MYFCNNFDYFIMITNYYSENKDPQENEKKKKSWKESKESERWLHDCYNESEQLPKSTKEIIDTYGYDIRNEDAPPRARRGRKYG